MTEAIPADPAGGLPVRHVSVNQLVAYNMAFFRKAAGLTQGQLGERLGWSGASVSAAERSWDGKRVRKFDADEIVSIALDLGVPVIALLLPPADAGTAARYILDFAPGQPDIARLLPALASASADGTPSMSAFWQRLIALGAGTILGPTVENAERMRAEATSMLDYAYAEAERITFEAHAATVILKETQGTGVDVDSVAAAGRAGLAINQLIADARREADETLGRARLEADGLLTKARHASEQITGDARARAEALERDAQARYQQFLGGLVQSREDLERRVDDLRAFEREYRSRLLAYLESQVRDLKAGTDESALYPAAPPGPALSEADPGE